MLPNSASPASRRCSGAGKVTAKADGRPFPLFAFRFSPQASNPVRRHRAARPTHPPPFPISWPPFPIRSASRQTCFPSLGRPSAARNWWAVAGKYFVTYSKKAICIQKQSRLTLKHRVSRGQSSRGLEHSKTLRAVRWSLANASASWTAAALRRCSGGRRWCQDCLKNRDCRFFAVKPQNQNK